MFNRHLFLTLAATIALAVGGTALFAPAVLLASKGVLGNAAAEVWMREVGAILMAVGVVAWSVRKHPDSPTLRALLWGNALLQALLLPIEIMALAQGTITAGMGIVPNSVLHVLLGLGFAACAIRTSLNGRT